MAVPDFEQIEGKYQILEKLGGGGMGAIYKVRHLLLDEVRVVKVIRPHLEGDAKLRDRFLREARSAVRLRHPNIAALYDFTMDEDGVAFMVMECIDGEDLKRLVRRHERLPIALGLEIGVQALRALRYLHGRSYIHRDISPDNLMLSRDVDGRLLVKLIDLGVAKSLEGSEELTRDGMFVGKFKYGAPEQFGGAGLSVDARTDLYSLGVVLYEVLTGQHPFPGESEREIVGGHLFHAPRDFSETDPQSRLSEELRSLLLHAMEKTPDDRFQHAEEFESSLREIRESWDGSDEDSMIELATRAAPDGAEIAADGSTQIRLNHDFPPEQTPPPLSDVRIVERTISGLDVTQTQVMAPRAGGNRILVGAIAALAVLGVIGLLALRDRAPVEDPATAALTDAVAESATEVPAVEPPPQEVAPIAEARAPATEPDSVPLETEPEAVETAPARRASPQPPPEQRSTVANPRVIALVGEARRAFNGGQDQVTLDRLRSVLAIEPQSTAAQRLLGELAKSADSKAARARRTAESAGALKRASAEFSQATNEQGRGSQALAGGRFEEAIASFWSSAEAFGRAAKQAEAQRESEAVAAREAQAERERQTAAQPTAPPASKADEQPAILATIEAFARAHETLDIANVLEVWPSLAGDRLSAVTQSLEGAREIGMSVSGCVVRDGSGSAIAQCTLEQSYRPRRGTRQSIRRAVTFRMAKRNGKWVVEDY